MHKLFFDIINFNADASCLKSEDWLEHLKGGVESDFCHWLKIYVDSNSKIVLGLTGASVSDIQTHNPEALDIINSNADIFQVIARSYSHDIPLLRTSEGFEFNLETGIIILSKTFTKLYNYYLPPEFMVTSQQIATLSRLGMLATFINSGRYPSDISARIPIIPYFVKGVMGSTIGCIPIEGDFTHLYLKSIQSFSVLEWESRAQKSIGHIYSWRDGESCFLLPNGLEREEFWVQNLHIERSHLGSEQYVPALEGPIYSSYPAHSFSAWVKEFRMMGYLRRVERIEEGLRSLPSHLKYLWLLTINSDVLSAIEKKSPKIVLRDPISGGSEREFHIFRSERHFEGEDYLAILEEFLQQKLELVSFRNSESAHIIKAIGRIKHLESIIQK